MGDGGRCLARGFSPSASCWRPSQDASTRPWSTDMTVGRASPGFSHLSTAHPGQERVAEVVKVAPSLAGRHGRGDVV